MDGFVVGLLVGFTVDKFTVKRKKILFPDVDILEILIPVFFTMFP